MTTKTGYSDVVPFRPDVYYIRDPPSIPLIMQTRSHLSSFIRIQVLDCLGSHTWRGRLEVDGQYFKGIPGEFTDTVVVKNAMDQLTIKNLEQERRTILDLRAAGVRAIPEVFGMFFYANIEETNNVRPLAALVMEDVGSPVEDIAEEAVSRHHMYVYIFGFHYLINKKLPSGPHLQMH
jgi:hypothetical protein